MSKIICDVCGTRYPESAEQCPICGCIRADGGQTAADSFVMEEAQAATHSRVRGGRFSKSNVRKRNKNMVRYEVPEERSRTRNDYAEEYEEMEPPKKSGAVINVLLVIVIVALLLVTGYIFVQYFLPNILAETETTAPTETVAETTEPTEAPTEEPTVPCTGLELVNGSTEVVLTERGQSWLLNLQVSPADCTDELIYLSSDETVVTVDAQGCVTSVGEGEAVVTVHCGEQMMEFNVVCFFINETRPETEETQPEEDATEAPTEAPKEPLKDVDLVVNKTDMTFRMIGQQVTMKVSNGLTNKEVTWTSENENIVTIDEDGIITCVGWGTTNIIASYGDQEVTIICRCIR